MALSSKIAELYYRLVKNGDWELSQVPSKWYLEVSQAIEADKK
jgi:hypothetical protein